MRIALFCHSLLSDWNHGNAHFLRGLVTELIARGHSVRTYEPEDAWSLTNLVAEHGEAPLEAVRTVYPAIDPVRYRRDRVDFDRALDRVQLVIVHEWNDPALVARLGERRKRGGRFRLLFHDTHHRAVTRPDEMAQYDLSGYDGVLAFGSVLAEIYRARGMRAWVFHEAADIRVFHPMPAEPRWGDLVWVGNWGDEERTVELVQFLLQPVGDLGLRATAYGVRYPAAARDALAAAGVTYGGWLPNFEVPQVFGRFAVTVHVPRRPYARALHGIPTIRPFEALACGIPLVSAPWEDVEGLFRPGEDFLMARDGLEMKRHLRAILGDPQLGAQLAEHGLRTIREKHTCGHRANELLDIAAELGLTESPVRVLQRR